MTQIIKTQGFVLNTTVFRETSLFATIFTNHYGKIQVLAKGCRRPKSKMCGGLERFNHIEVIFYKRETKETYTISDTSIIDDFPAIRQHPGTVNGALVMCEFLYRTLPAEEPDIRSYILLERFLHTLEKTIESDAKSVTIQCLLRALSYAGVSPHLDSCVRCHHPISYGSKRLDFSVSGGGLVCEQDHDDTVVLLPQTAIKALLTLYQDETAVLTNETVDEIARILPDYLCYHLNGLVLHSLKQLQ